MAIRYDKNLNAEIRRVVHNFNQKRNRAIKRGFTHLPPRLLVSELKARYSTKSELTKELKIIESFNKSKDDALKIVETSGGAKAIKWEYQYLKRNINAAKDHYDRLIKKASQYDTVYDIGRKHTLETLQRNREMLDLELSELSQNDFNTFKTTINKYIRYNYLADRYYKGFLTEVMAVIQYSGYDEKTANTFINKLKVLSPLQFIEMYNDSQLISRVYELADSPIHGKGMKFTTSADDAKMYIDTLLEEADALVEKYSKL